MRRVRAGAAGGAAAAPLFPAARRSGRLWRGPRGAGASGGHERVGAAAGGDPGRQPAPPPRPAGGCARPGCGAMGAGVRPPRCGRTCGGARLASLLGLRRKAPLSPRSFVWAAGRAGPLRRFLGPASFRFPSLPGRLGQLDPRQVGALSPERRSEFGTRAAEVGVFHQPGRVKFENRLRAKKLWRLSQQLVWRDGSSSRSDVLGCLKLG